MPGSGLPSSASQFRRSRRRDRFLCPAVPTTSKSSWAGLPALKSPNNVLVLFRKVEIAPSTTPQSAIWHFGWHVTDVRKTLDTYKSRAGVKLAALYIRRRRLGPDQQRYLARHRRRARAHQDADCRGAGQSAPSRRAAADLPTCKAPTAPSWSTRATARPSASIVHMWQEDLFCAQLWYQKHSMRGCHRNASAPRRGPRPIGALIAPGRRSNRRARSARPRPASSSAMCR